jgi:predicted DNA-binding transcriptional regulator AlpA
MQPDPTAGRFEVDGRMYLSLEQVAREIQVSRTTLWRWRQSGKIPAGHRYRGRLTLFSLAELETIRGYANRLAPIGLALDGKLR